MDKYGCARCDKTWTGLSRCHCSACHQTFGNVGLFDWHRFKDGCRDPKAKMTLKAGIWLDNVTDSDLEI